MKFKRLIKENKLNILQTRVWLEKMGIGDYRVNEDWTIDVEGDVDLYAKNVTEIPVQFGRVNGWFDCSDNGLTSLKGCPREVTEDFNCSKNNLETLHGCPEYVGGDFECFDNFKHFTSEDVEKLCDVKGETYC